MNGTSILDKILDRVSPVYEKILKDNHFGNICSFCVQWGENFPSEENRGMLFVGKAVNGWVTKEKTTKILFSKSHKERIFARDDQMKWVKNLEGNKAGYNTKKSAFWRVVKKTCQVFYPNEEWYSYVAWSNLYKISPWSGGNPNKKLRDKQQEYCYEILKNEIEVLSPEFVVMLTSGWEISFLKFLNDGKAIKCMDVSKWSRYQTEIYEINNVFFIVSPHPQGKTEKKHVKVIEGLVKKYRE